MAISWRYQSYGLLDDWREYTFENIWHINQAAGSGAPLIAPSYVYIQDERDMIARSINSAFQRVTDALEYPPKPIYITEQLSFGAGWYPFQALKLRYGHIQSVGARTSTLIQAAAPIVYSAFNTALGINDTATITVNTTVDVSQIEIYFQVADGAVSGGAELWRIEPVTITRINATQVEIVGSRALFVSPNLFWKRPKVGPNFQERNEADTSSAADFVTAVDLYRVYPDSTTAVALVSEDYATCVIGCDDDIHYGCAHVVNSEQGIVNIRQEDFSGCQFPPYAVRITYLAGYPMQYGFIDPDLGQAVIRLANCFMPERVMPIHDQTWDAWAKDRQDQDRLLAGEGNPFGSKIGQIAAWKIVDDRRLGRAAKLTLNRPFGYAGGGRW